jgi:imidazolonepropionase-like amidohydrolase
MLVIKNGTLIDGTGGRPWPNGRIEIRGAKIAEVGPETPFDYGGGARVIDAAGRFILPGLIDGHVHLSTYRTMQLGCCAAQSRTLSSRRVDNARTGSI